MPSFAPADESGLIDHDLNNYLRQLCHESTFHRRIVAPCSYTEKKCTLIPETTAEEYHCGMGAITKTLSRYSAYFCDSSLLTNQCCLPHDDCYSKIGKYRSTMTHAVCDIKFKHCINQNYRDRFFCRSWLVATHYIPLTVSSFFRRYF